MKSPVISAELSELKQKVQQEKSRADFLNDSCKKYLLAYEKAKREVERLSIENDRLKTRISEAREISLAKEANYEMINQLGTLDKEFFQTTIEKLRQDNHVLKEENKLLKDISDIGVHDNKKQIFAVIKERQEQVLVQNAQLLFQNEVLRGELMKCSGELDEINEKHKELLAKQLEQAKILVRKDEEVRFWKCSLLELICGEVVKSYQKEEEIKLLMDSPLEHSDKFLRIKDKLSKLVDKRIADSIAEISGISATMKSECKYQDEDEDDD